MVADVLVLARTSHIANTAAGEVAIHEQCQLVPAQEVVGSEMDACPVGKRSAVFIVGEHAPQRSPIDGCSAGAHDPLQLVDVYHRDGVVGAGTWLAKLKRRVTVADSTPKERESPTSTRASKYDSRARQSLRGQECVALARSEAALAVEPASGWQRQGFEATQAESHGGPCYIRGSSRRSIRGPSRAPRRGFACLY